MIPVAIPAWTASGLLPPIDPNRPTSSERSPYFVSLSELVLRFNTSAERRTVLDGFLRYRSRLHAVGLISGFQWLDGSFFENIEEIEGRVPRDIDVVTYYRLPQGISQADVLSRDPSIFPRTKAERLAMKDVYNVDAFLVDLGTPPDRLVERSAYWYGVWSHRRDSRWKGYLSVDLAPEEDHIAAETLKSPPTPGGTS